MTRKGELRSTDSDLRDLPLLATTAKSGDPFCFLYLKRTGGPKGRRGPRSAADQNRNCGPKLTRRLLCAPLLKKMLSPISARTPIGPANASMPAPGYKAK